MALENDGLSAAIKAKLTAGEPEIEDAKIQKFCDDLAEAIIDYFVANTEVSASGADPQGGIVSVTGTIS